MLSYYICVVEFILQVNPLHFIEENRYCNQLKSHSTTAQAQQQSYEPYLCDVLKTKYRVSNKKKNNNRLLTKANRNWGKVLK